MRPPNKRSTFPIRGTVGRGKNAGKFADGKGDWLEAAKFEREEKALDAKHAEWLAQQGRRKSE